MLFGHFFFFLPTPLKEHHKNHSDNLPSVLHLRKNTLEDVTKAMTTANTLNWVLDFWDNLLNPEIPFKTCSSQQRTENALKCNCKGDTMTTQNRKKKNHTYTKHVLNFCIGWIGINFHVGWIASQNPERSELSIEVWRPLTSWEAIL